MSNVVQIGDIRRHAPASTRGVYLRITEQGIVEYGLEDVSNADAHRLLRALLLLGSRLMEIGGGNE
jgi:hypothetical protein